MLRIGLTLEEYEDLRYKPQGKGDPGIGRAAEVEPDEMFPMSAMDVSNHLRSRGYDCRPQMLDLLIENGVVKPSQQHAWSQADVEAVAEHLEDAAILTPYATMCETFGCRLADFLRPLREAAERESKKYGQRVPDDDQYFVMHRQPPRGVMDDDDDLVDTQPAVISFTLCDDIRERLERGEEV